MKTIRKRVIGLAALGALCTTAAFYVYGRSVWVPAYQALVGRQTLAQVLAAYGASARARLAPYFEAAGADYPPEQVTLLAIKDTATLELWVGPAERPTLVRRYAIQKLSGTGGPKLREGDRQVPEGLYRVVGLNPDSSYHLSMKLNYPNSFDRANARAEGRDNPGSDIFIHGKAVSIGCLAMGDQAIEELFVLAADAGKDKVRVIIAPTDPRLQALDTGMSPRWVSDLYRQVSREFHKYPLSPPRPSPLAGRGP